MKAVIMAGGEGTRLRPLTSNAPKPMLPAGQPADDGAHRRPAASGTASTRSWSRWPSWPTPSAPTSATAPSSACRWSTPPRRRRSAPPARCATPWTQLDERFLVISGDVLTDIDLGEIVDFHDEQRRMATIGLVRGREPARVRHRHHPARTARSSASSRSRRGARCSATPSTPASSCSSPRSSTTSPAGRPVDFSSEVFPALLADGQAAVRRRRRGLLGGRRHARGLPAAPTRTSSTARSRVDIPGFELDRRRVAGGGGRGPPRRPGRRARPSSATNCRVEAGARIGRVHGARRQRAGARPRPTSSARVVHDNAYLGEARAPAGHGHRPGLRPAQRRALRRGRRARRRVLRRRRRRASAPTSRCTRSRRSRPAPSSTPRSCGSRRGARSLFGRDGVAGPGQRRHHPRARRQGGHGLRHHAARRAPRSSPRATPAASARMLKRAMMAGLNAAGVNVLDLEVASRAGHPLPRPPARGRRRASPSGCVDGDPQIGASSASSTATASTSPRTPSARSSGCSTGRTSAGCCPARSATSASRPGPSSSTPPRSRPPSTSSAIRDRRLQGGRRLRATASTVVRDAQRAGQARRRRAGRQPLRLDRRASSASTATRTPPSGGRPGAGLGRPPRRGASTPTASTSRSSTTRATCSTTPRRCWPSSTLVCRPPARRPHRPARSPPRQRAERPGRRPRRRRSQCTKMSHAGADGRGHRAGRRLRRQRRRRVHPPGLPAGLRRRRRAREGARPARPAHGRRCPTVVDGAARACTSPTRPW